MIFVLFTQKKIGVPTTALVFIKISILTEGKVRAWDEVINGKYLSAMWQYRATLSTHISTLPYPAGASLEIFFSEKKKFKK